MTLIVAMHPSAAMRGPTDLYGVIEVGDQPILNLLPLRGSMSIDPRKSENAGTSDGLWLGDAHGQTEQVMVLMM